MVPLSFKVNLVNDGVSGLVSVTDLRQKLTLWRTWRGRVWKTFRPYRRPEGPGVQGEDQAKVLGGAGGWGPW